MLSDEEKEEALSETEIRFRADLLILNSEFPTHRKTEAMEELLEIYNKQSKEIEELKKPKYVINCKTNEITKLTNDFVSKDKIKAKIEELNKDFKEYENGQEWEIQDEIRGQIDVLQSLLEKE